jgi:hypothetical protein
MIIFCILLFVSLIIGLGWALVLNPFEDSKTAVLAIAIIVSQFIVVFCWTWSIGLGQGIWIANLLIVLLGLTGWMVAIKYSKWRIPSTKNSPSRECLLPVVLVLFAVFLGLGPKLSTGGSLGMALRVGPDALGNAIAGEALFSNSNLREIENNLLDSSNSKDMNEFLDPTQRKPYQIDSFRNQVRGEFLVAGLRWGLSGAIASSVTIVGAAHLWSVIAVLPTISFLASLLLLYVVLVRRLNRPWLSALLSMAALGNISLLQGWHEGGLGQAFVTPVVPVLLIFLWDGQRRWRANALLAVVAAISLVSYSDVFIVMGIVLVLYALTTLFFGDQQDRIQVGQLLMSVIVGVATVLPYLIKFVGYLPRRLEDSAKGGWMMASWPSPVEILGLFPSFYESATGLTEHPNSVITFFTITNPIICGGVLALVIVKRSQTSARLVFSLVVVLFFVMFKSRILESASNYQYVKAVGSLAPLLVVLIVELIFRNIKTHRIGDLLLHSLPAVGILISIGFVTAYRGNSLMVPAHEQSMYIDSSRTLDNLNLVSPSSFHTVVLSPFSAFYWINRDAAGTRPDFTSRINNPLGLVVYQTDCPSWRCLSLVPYSKILNVSEEIKVVQLNPRSTQLLSPSGVIREDYLKVINELLSVLGFQVDEAVHPILSQNSA